jgi:hypothetical protein
MGRIQEIPACLPTPLKQHLLLLQALELLVVKTGSAALVGGELVGHGV